MTVAVVGYDLCPEVTIANHRCKFGTPAYSSGCASAAHDRLWPFRRRASCRRVLAIDWRASPRSAARSGAGRQLNFRLFDLSPLVHTTMAQDLRLDDAEARKVSPLFWPAPKGRTFDASAGGLESSEFLRQSRVIADTWGKAGVAEPLRDHRREEPFTAADPLADPQSAMVGRLVKLTGSVQNQ